MNALERSSDHAQALRSIRQVCELNLVVPYTDGISNGPWKLNTKHLQAIKADRRKGAKGE